MNNKDLAYYQTEWNLTNPQLLTQTLTSHIYTVTHGSERALSPDLGSGYLLLVYMWTIERPTVLRWIT